MRNKLDNPERRELLPPERVLEQLGLSEGHIIADIGCGIGYFTLPASQIVGVNGRVYALDISEKMIQTLMNKIQHNNLKNIETIQVEENNYKLADNSIDYALACLVVHETENPVDFFSEVHRILKAGGRFAIIEWIKKTSKMGPPINHRLDPFALEILLQQVGYKNINHIAINDEMYAILAENQ